MQTFKMPSLQFLTMTQYQLLQVLQLLLPFFPQDSSTVTMNVQRTCEPISPKFRKATWFIYFLGIYSSESQEKFFKHQDGVQTPIKIIKSTFTFYFNRPISLWKSTSGVLKTSAKLKCCCINIFVWVCMCGCIAYSNNLVITYSKTLLSG